jgi:hypothetical protein
MRATLMEIARARFEPMARDIRSGSLNPSSILHVVEACAESIPLDLLEQIAPELARQHHGEAKSGTVDPVEGYLSTAEFIVDRNSQPYG